MGQKSQKMGDVIYGWLPSELCEEPILLLNFFFHISSYRLMVPWSTKDSWIMEVRAHWSQQFSSTPLWLYIKRAGLPSTTNFDKT